MGKNIPLFEYPEFKETFDELLDKLLKESGRGAVLIGTGQGLRVFTHDWT